MSFESVALVKKWGRNWLTMDGRDWSIGYFSGSHILEQLCFKRRKMIATQLLIHYFWSWSPGGRILNKGLGDSDVSYSWATPSGALGYSLHKLFLKERRKVAIWGQAGLMEGIHIRENSALLKGYRGDREMKDSTRSWRRMWLVKDDEFSKTEKKQIRRSKAMDPKPLAASFSVCFLILLLLSLSTWRCSPHPLVFWKSLELLLKILPNCPFLNKQTNE